MNADESAAVVDEFNKALLDCLWPHFAVVVTDNGIVGYEVWFPACPGVRCGLFGRAGGNGYGKCSTGLEGFFENGGGCLPLVVVLAVDDKHLEFGAFSKGYGYAESGEDE